MSLELVFSSELFGGFTCRLSEIDFTNGGRMPDNDVLIEYARAELIGALNVIGLRNLAEKAENSKLCIDESIPSRLVAPNIYTVYICDHCHSDVNYDGNEDNREATEYDSYVNNRC